MGVDADVREGCHQHREIVRCIDEKRRWETMPLMESISWSQMLVFAYLEYICNL